LAIKSFKLELLTICNYSLEP